MTDKKLLDSVRQFRLLTDLLLQRALLSSERLSEDVVLND